MKTSELIKLINNPGIYEVNKKQARAHKRVVDLEDNCLEQNLDGDWDFTYVDNINKRDEQFMNNVNSETEINVPSHIELNNFGQIQYVNTQYQWDGLEDVKVGNSPIETNTLGQYKKQVTVTNIEQFEQFVLCFEGVESCFNLWVNGNYVGFSSDTFTTAEFDIKEWLVDGLNLIAVEVYRFSAASWLNDQDFWRFSGIFRSVSLKSITHQHIIDFDLNYCIKGNNVTGNIELSRNGQFDTILKIYHQGELLETINTDGSQIKFEISEAKLWNAEEPYLYQFVFETKTEKFYKNIGFREVKIEDGVILLNNKRIVFKGINRHEFDSTKGRAIGYEEIKQDLLLLKEHNFNSIRCAHYPNNNVFYELCDELGFYVIDEVNLETHGTWEQQAFKEVKKDILPDNDQRYRENVLSRASNLYGRDKNNSCVIMWSLGNESFGGKVFSEMADYFRKVDSSRLVHYEGISWDRRYPNTSDVESQMYTRSEDIEKFLQGNSEKPFIVCEYSHAMGNSNGNFTDYLDLEQKYPSYQGGFIWEYMDQAIYMNGRFNYGGDFDDCPSDYNFICDGLVGPKRTITSELKYIANLYSPVKVVETEHAFIIENQNVFKSLSNLNIKVFKQGENNKTSIKEFVVNLKAGEKYELSKIQAMGVVLYQVSSKNKLLKEFSTVAYEQIVSAKCGSQARFVDGAHNFSMISDKFTITFSKVLNNLVSIKYEGEELIESFEAIPKPNFWRAPTNNDKGAKKEKEFAIWKIISNYQNSKIINYKYDLQSLVVDIEFTSNLCSDYKCLVRYVIDNDGSIAINVDYKGIENVPDFFEFGLKLGLNSRYKYCNYLGCANIDTYCDRNFDVVKKYSSFEIEKQSSYLYPQEFGNKTEVYWIKVYSEHKKGFIIESENKFEFSLIPYSDAQLEHTRNSQDLKLETPQLKINYKQAGVAGDDTWGSWAKSDYVLDSNQNINFNFKIWPL